MGKKFFYREGDQRINIAEGATDPGVDRFNEINNLKNPAIYPQAAQPLSHHTQSLPTLQIQWSQTLDIVDTNPCLVW